MVYFDADDSGLFCKPYRGKYIVGMNTRGLPRGYYLVKEFLEFEKHIKAVLPNASELGGDLSMDRLLKHLLGDLPNELFGLELSVRKATAQGGIEVYLPAVSFVGAELNSKVFARDPKGNIVSHDRLQYMEVSYAPKLEQSELLRNLLKYVDARNGEVGAWSTTALKRALHSIPKEQKVKGMMTKGPTLLLYTEERSVMYKDKRLASCRIQYFDANRSQANPVIIINSWPDLISDFQDELVYAKLGLKDAWVEWSSNNN
jgi:hypothetical protein